MSDLKVEGHLRESADGLRGRKSAVSNIAKESKKQKALKQLQDKGGEKRGNSN